MNLPVSAFEVKVSNKQEFFEEQPEFQSLSFACKCEVCGKDMNTCSFFETYDRVNCLDCIQVYYPDTQLVAHSAICSTKCRLEKEQT